MSHPSHGYGNTFAGYDYDQKQGQAPAGQGYGGGGGVQSQHDGYAQARVVNTSSHHLSPFSAPLPTHNPPQQLQHQPWQQQQHNAYQEHFFTAQTSPQYSQGFSQPVYANTPQTHSHPSQQSWQQTPQILQSQPVVTGYHQTPYASASYQTQPGNTFPSQPNMSHGHPQRPYPTGQARSGYSEQPTPSPVLQTNSRSLQPQSVNQQPRPAQLQTNQSSHMPQKAVQDQPHSQKRRKSNDGTSVPQPANLQQLKTKPRPQQSSSPLTDLRSSQAPPPTPQRDDPDLCTVLLTVAEEYITAAHSMVAVDSKSMQHYHRLIASAMTCLESALANFRQTDARREAYTRLKLAALIFEETEDGRKAEEILSKGISTCERARLSDLRFTMHHLHIRILHSNNPKAAIKAVDKMIAEVQVLRLVHWSFAFRFLKFTLGLSDASTDGVSLLRQLTQINEIARANNKVPLSCLISCLEAMISLRSGTTEGLESAQRSLADVRSNQLNPELERLPQLKAMICQLDLACHITTFSADQMKSALPAMQNEQEAASKAKGWRDDGSFIVTLGIKAEERLRLDTPGVFAVTATGELGLSYKWLTKGAMLTVGYVLNGMTLLPRNGETFKSEVFFREALKINDYETTSRSTLEEIHAADQHKRSTRAAIRFIMACTFAARAKYGEAVTMLKEFNKEHTSDTTDIDRIRLKFMTASCLQGSGELQKALELYSTWLHEFDAEKRMSPVMKDIQVLAILNSVHIMRTISPDSTARSDTLLKSVEPYCLSHPNKSFASVYYVIESSTASAHTTIGAVKKSLNQALVPAQAVKNKQLLALIMNMMSETFFTDLVGQQAKSSSNAGRTLAKQSGDELWVAVGAGMLRDTLERSGHLDDAIEANNQAHIAVHGLPRAVQASLGLR